MGDITIEFEDALIAWIIMGISIGILNIFEHICQNVYFVMDISNIS